MFVPPDSNLRLWAAHWRKRKRASDLRTKLAGLIEEDADAVCGTRIGSTIPGRDSLGQAGVVHPAHMDTVIGVSLAIAFAAAAYFDHAEEATVGAAKAGLSCRRSPLARGLSTLV